MPIDVGVNTYLELYFMISILLHVIECTCWNIYIYIYIECKKMHGMSNIKNYVLVVPAFSHCLFFDTPFAVAAMIHRCAPDQVFMACMMIGIIMQLLINCFLKTLLSYQADITGFIILLFKL